MPKNKNEITPKDISVFQKKYVELEKKQYVSIQAEMKRNLSLSKKIKVKNPTDHFKWLMDLLMIKANDRYFKVNGKVTKLVKVVDNQEISFLQVYQEFYLETTIKFKKSKIVYTNQIKHIMPLVSDSSNGIMLKNYLKKDFKERYKKIKDAIFKEVKK